MPSPNEPDTNHRSFQRRLARFRGTSLATKLQFVAALLLLVIVAYVATTLRKQSDTNAELRSVVDTRLASRDAAEDMRLQLLIAHVTMLDFLASGRTVELDKSHAALMTALKEIDRLKAQDIGPTLAGSLDSLKTEVNRYAGEARRLHRYALPAPGLDQRQVANVADRLRIRMRRLEELSEVSRRGFQARLDGSRARFRRILSEQPRKTALSAGAIAVMLILVLIRQLWLLRSLRWVLHAVKLIERGNLDVQIPMTSRDEVGQLANSVNKMVRKVRASRDSLMRENVTDALTGLYNQRQFRPLLHDEFERAVRQGLEFSLLMIDIDHFKRVNDTYGHEAGNVILKTVSQALSENLREIDVLIRYGGDEFAAILPGANAVEGWDLAARLGRLSGAVTLPDGQLTQVTLSIGGATFPAHAESEDDLIRQADDALYRAKDAGRAQAHWASVAVARIDL